MVRFREVVRLIGSKPPTSTAASQHQGIACQSKFEGKRSQVAAPAAFKMNAFGTRSAKNAGEVVAPGLSLVRRIVPTALWFGERSGFFAKPCLIFELFDEIPNRDRSYQDGKSGTQYDEVLQLSENTLDSSEAKNAPIVAPSSARKTGGADGSIPSGRNTPGCYGPLVLFLPGPIVLPDRDHRCEPEHDGAT